ncbi:MAG: ribonuclease Z [Bacteroidales bacterium]|jgi:ribonuclease Z|nr:ribonuclease Z [Bacteroidales bacterium]
MVFSVTILGSSAALPTSQRFSTSQLLQAGERSYLIDCAEGTQIQFRRFHLPFGNLKAIFISHLHGDHVFGLPGLLSSLNLLDRKEPLDIFGPAPLEEWINGHLKFFAPLSYPLHIHCATCTDMTAIYEDKRITVGCFPLQHRIPTWGYLFREKERPANIRKDMIRLYGIPLREIPAIKAGADYRMPDGKIIPNHLLAFPPVQPRSYAYCSDTVYLERLPAMLRNVHLLYHEATFANDQKLRSAETFHSTAEEAATIAKAANAGKLIIGHFSTRYDNLRPLLQEAQAIFKNTEAAEDGKTFEVKQPSRPTSDHPA